MGRDGEERAEWEGNTFTLHVSLSTLTLTLVLIKMCELKHEEQMLFLVVIKTVSCGVWIVVVVLLQVVWRRVTFTSTKVLRMEVCVGSQRCWRGV